MNGTVYLLEFVRSSNRIDLGDRDRSYPVDSGGWANGIRPYGWGWVNEIENIAFLNLVATVFPLYALRNGAHKKVSLSI